MRKILPFTQPLAYAYQFYAFPLGILATRPAATDWVLSNHIQVTYDLADKSPVPFAFYLYDFTISPWLETLRLDRAWVGQDKRGIDGVVRDAISADYYVYLTLNERYVPRRAAFGGTADHSHDVLIRGIDDPAGTVELYGYDQDLRFAGSQLPQNALPRAYHDHGTGSFYDVPLTLYRYRDDGCYTFDLGFVARGIGEYVDSYNSSLHYQALQDPWPRVFGMATYAPLEAYLDGYGRGLLPYDIRTLQVLWEHKRLMVARLARCAEVVPEVGDLIAGYRMVERRAWLLRALMLAHRTGRPVADFRGEAISLLRQIETADKSTMDQARALLEAARADLWLANRTSA